MKIQNRGLATETIPDAAALVNLLELSVSSLGTCPDPIAAPAPPSAKSFPIEIKYVIVKP